MHPLFESADPPWVTKAVEHNRKQTTKKMAALTLAGKQSWEFAHRFSEQITKFYPKMSEWANERFAQKNEWFTQLLIFGDRPERFDHYRSFPLSDLSLSLMVTHFWWATWAIRSHRSFDLSEMSDSLTSLTKKEEMSENKWFAHFFNNFFFFVYKTYLNKILDFFSQNFFFLSESLSRSFPLGDLSKLLMVAHLS